MGLSVSNLSVLAGDKCLLNSVSFEVGAGRICVILGPNGAGKSTLLKTLAGLNMPSSGSASIDAFPLASLAARERARAIGYLPQDYRLAWDIGVTDIVKLGRYAHARDATDDAAIIEEAMTQTDILQFADRTGGTLSGGELARVMLARLIAGQHRFILADEPLASLDPAYQIDICDRLRVIATGGTGMLLVLHDIALAARVADDILMLKDGCVLAGGPAANTLRADNLSALYDVSVSQRDDGSFALG